MQHTHKRVAIYLYYNQFKKFLHFLFHTNIKIITLSGGTLCNHFTCKQLAPHKTNNVVVFNLSVFTIASHF